VLDDKFRAQLFCFFDIAMASNTKLACRIVDCDETLPVGMSETRKWVGES